MGDEVTKALSTVEKIKAYIAAHPQLSHTIVAVVTLILSKSKVTPWITSLVMSLLGVQ